MVEFNLPVTIGAFVLVIVLGIVGLEMSPTGMATDTILMMVAPSMIVFGAICLAIGVKHGEHRATQRR